ncbi:WD40 repeat domain-containing protein [Capilliphycus salinus ALCB114379]|uniref:WD40 repeat domain-containing protein n=1 Tax=Capilliphycus salinus TaxID=2768948 RepID=UPI0039A7491A
MAASEQLDKQEIQAKLAAEKQANDVLTKAKKRASLISLITIGILGLSSLIAVLSIKKADDNLKLAEIHFNSANAKELLASGQGLQSIITALKASQDLKKVPTSLWSEVNTEGTVMSVFHEVLDQAQEQNSISGHGSYVYSVAFSRDGDMIATASDDNTVKLWDLDGTLVKTLEGHESSVYGVAFSRDGEMIATAGSDKTVLLWTVDDLDDLIAEGCTVVSDYLKNNPNVTEEERRLCGVEASATAWFLQGEQLARQGNIDEAVDQFKQAVKLDPNFSLNLAAASLVRSGEWFAWSDEVDEAILAFQAALEFDPSLTFNPENKANAIASLLEGSNLAENGKIDEAIAQFENAQKIDADLKIDAWYWNQLCWEGSLNKQGSKVMLACENAVKLAPKNETFINSRGVARALTGDFEGAIKDFEVYVQWTNDEEDKAQRKGWIESLKKGENPLTDEELKGLR